MKILLELPMDRQENVRPGTKNLIANAACEIIRLPNPGVRVPGASVGDRVKGRIVLQYVGPIVVEFLDDETSQPKRSHAISRKRAAKSKITIKKAAKRARSISRATRSRT